jgi:hypothetical protein
LHRLRHVVPAGRRIPDLIAGLPKTRSALAYAERLHVGQQRGVDGAPFILHPIEVASLLYYAGAADHVIAAGALHDTIEKTDATPSILRKHFGSRIAELVLARWTTPDRAREALERPGCAAVRRRHLAPGHGLSSALLVLKRTERIQLCGAPCREDAREHSGEERGYRQDQ